MTNEEILLVFNSIQEVIRLSTPEELKPFSYAFIKNKLKFKKVFDERDEHILLIKENNKDVSDKELQEIISNDENFQKFLKEDSEIELYTMKLDSLEGKEFNIAVDALVGTILIE